jgi:hypothetical protein
LPAAFRRGENAEGPQSINLFARTGNKSALPAVYPGETVLRPTVEAASRMTQQSYILNAGAIGTGEPGAPGFEDFGLRIATADAPSPRWPRSRRRQRTVP